MQKAWLTTNREAGFSAVEALLAALVFGVIATGLIGAMVYGRASGASSGVRQRANLLAEEGIDAARNIANASYSNLVDGTYGVVKSGGVWTLSGTNDNTDIYARQVTVSSSGTDRKDITSTVYWSQPGSTLGFTQLTTRISNWEASIKSWSNAAIIGSADATGTADGIKVAIQGNYAYLVRNTTSSNFVVLDISTPTAPTIVSTTTVTGTPTNIAVSGNYAYVTTTTASGGLRIMNVATPSAPTLAKTVALTGTSAAQSVYISGSYAYVVRSADTGTGANEFNIVNITTPTSASVVGGYNNNITMGGVYVSGNYAYVATSSTTAEMLVINVTTKTAPTLSATYNPSTALVANTVTGYGNTVWLGMSTTLDAINITTPTSPTRLGTFTAAGTINDIELDSSAQYAFLGTSSTTGEIQIVNVGTPASMSLAKTIDVSGTTSTVTGIDYSPTYDVFMGASAADTLEAIVVGKN